MVSVENISSLWTGRLHENRAEFTVTTIHFPHHMLARSINIAIFTCEIQFKTVFRKNTLLLIYTVKKEILVHNSQYTFGIMLNQWKHEIKFSVSFVEICIKLNTFFHFMTPILECKGNLFNLFTQCMYVIEIEGMIQST